MTERYGVMITSGYSATCYRPPTLAGRPGTTPGVPSPGYRAETGPEQG